MFPTPKYMIFPLYMQMKFAKIIIQFYMLYYNCPENLVLSFLATSI